MSFRTDLLAAVQGIRKIPQALDLRQHAVYVRVTDWTGERSGLGTGTVTETLLTTGDGVTNVRVQEVSSRDVIASGGRLSATDLKLGPTTPTNALGGVLDTVFNPAYGAAGRDIVFRITGPGMGDEGTLFKRKNDTTLPNFSKWIYLESIGVDTL